MRGILSAVAGYPAELGRQSAAGWNRFWFAPADPTLLGVIRFLTGLMLLYNHAVWGLALADFFGPDGWISADLAEVTQHTQTAYSFWWLVPPRYLWPAYLSSMVVLVLFTIGFQTRVTSALALAVLISFAYRVPEATFGLDKTTAILTFYLAIGPSGAAFSVDHWLARRKQGASPHPVASSFANFTLRLIQVHMCTFYLFAGLAKLQGMSWWSGEAMWMTFANLEYQATDMTWLAWHPWVVDFLTHISVALEVAFCVLVWVPILRPLVLAGMVLLHLGIGACLGLWTFSLIMIVGCMSFLPAEDVGRLVERVASRARDQ
jgi:uncharacterized membrane protein YphA (DoxX/SURF4 family)